MSTTQERVDGAVDGHRDAMRAILERQRQAFVTEGPPSMAARRDRIDRLLALVLDNADAFVDAMSADYGTRPKTGSLFTEILGMVAVIEHTRSHVPQWMRATKLMRAGRLFGLKAEVQPSPLGVVGIIGPWNFPLNLVVLPASAAFAAGNRVMIKMSEITAQTADLMKAAAPKYFDPAELDVVTGGPEVATAFSTLPFDHLFFTGSPSVGALVQQAAARNRSGDAGTWRQESCRGVARRRPQALCGAHRGGSHDQRRAGMHLSRLRFRARRSDGLVRRRRTADAAWHVRFDRVQR
jgi:coniferyl-aldehyde dehydrogenase